jgi:hypothetical protein
MLTDDQIVEFKNKFTAAFEKPGVKQLDISVCAGNKDITRRILLEMELNEKEADEFLASLESMGGK